MTRLCQQAEARVQALQKTLRRAIGKSRPYFELKAQFSQILEVAALECRRRNGRAGQEMPPACRVGASAGMTLQERAEGPRPGRETS